MKLNEEILGKSVLILGYGREGQSVHRYLKAQYKDIVIGIADKSLDLHTGKNYLDALKNYDVIIRSPGVPLHLQELQEAKRAGKVVTSATNIFFSQCPGIIIGVTGAKGKSTTATLIATILSKKHKDVRLVGNIGNPALDSLSGSTKNTIFVAELSSYQLEDAIFSPHIAVVLEIFKEHLDHHKDFKSYIQAKSNIVRHQKSRDIVVFNPAHEVTKKVASKSKGHKLHYGLKESTDLLCYISRDKIFIRPLRKKSKLPKVSNLRHLRGRTLLTPRYFGLNVDEIPLLGTGNVENTLAAISVGILLDIPLSEIRAAIKSFKSLPHRLEFVGEINGIKFYNDSLATIPEATIHALNTLGRDVETLVAGGYDRGLDYSSLGEFLSKRGYVRNLILFPTTGEKIWKAVCREIPNRKGRPQKFYVNSMGEAVGIAFEKTSSGKICLLSPASASFGLFKNYEERGNLFKKWVFKIGKKEKI